MSTQERDPISNLLAIAMWLLFGIIIIVAGIGLMLGMLLTRVFGG